VSLSLYFGDPRLPLAFLSGPDAGQQGEFAPLPVAVDVSEPNLAQPGELCFKIEQFVGRIFLIRRSIEAAQEVVVQQSRWRSDVLEIAEDASWNQQVEDLAIEAEFALVCDVMNGETRDHAIEVSQSGQGIAKVVTEDGDVLIAAKTLPECAQHRWGKVEGNKMRLGPGRPDQIQ